MSYVIDRIKKNKVTNTFILYIDEDSDSCSSDVVCNLKCLHCYYRYSSKKFKQYEKIKEEIDLAILRGTDHIQITGGEPTIYPEFFKTIKYIKSKNLFCSVITNAVKLANVDFVKQSKKYIDYFLCSCHAGNEKTMTKITQNPNSWNSVFKAFENLDKNNIEFHINFTIMSLNHLQLKKLVQKLLNYNMFKRINIITFNPWESLEEHSSTEDISTLLVSYDKMYNVINDALKLAKENGVEVAVRYFPFCKIPKWLYKYNFNYTTEILDFNEWNFEMWMPKEFYALSPKLHQISQKLHLDGSLQQRLSHAFSLSFYGFRKEFKVLEECKECKLRFICNQPHKDYVKKFPNMKFDKLTGDYILDAGYYIKMNNTN